MNQEDIIPGNTYTSPINNMGDDNKKCEKDILNQAQTKKQNRSQPVEHMQVPKCRTNKKYEYPNEYYLDPAASTFEDIKRFALTKIPRLNSVTTINKYLNIARLMETHPVFPVNFKIPSWQNFFQHMEYIQIEEQQTANVLHSRRKTWHMFTKAWGKFQEWPIYKLPPVPNRSKDIIIPTPETVHSILTHKYTADKYLNRFIQYGYFIGFMIGMRAPSEMRNLNVNDVYLDETDNYLITITEPKKHGNRRKLKLENKIAVSKTRKSFKNYIDTIRPHFAKKRESALLVDPQTGKRWKTEDQLRYHLNYYATQVWKNYHPYTMRHWCATARCVEWKNDYRVLLRVKDWLGHTSIGTTEKYIDLASFYDNNKGSWISRALKTLPVMWGLLKVPIERNLEKSKRFVQSVRGTTSVSLQVRYSLFERLERNFYDFLQFVFWDIHLFKKFLESSLYFLKSNSIHTIPVGYRSGSLSFFFCNNSSRGVILA